MTTQITHKLKTWPVMFQAMLDGDKPFDVRRDDRGFQTGDIADMREFDHNRQQYSGRAAKYLITYVLRGKDYPHLGVNLDYCVLGIAPIIVGGVGLIKEERRRQVDEEKFTAARDDRLIHGELAILAGLYALPRQQRVIDIEHEEYQIKDWIWSANLNEAFWKPAQDNRLQSRIRELVKAGALIAAEIDRLKRQE